MKMSIQKTDGNNIKIIDGVSYDEWFGRESESAREFGEILTEYSNTLRGQWITSISGDSSQGFCNLFFEKNGLSIWFNREGRCKMRLGGQDTFGRKENFMAGCRGIFGKALLAVYPGGRNGSRTAVFLFGDKMAGDYCQGSGVKKTSTAQALRISYSNKESKLLFSIEPVEIVNGAYVVLSSEKVPMTRGSYKQRLRNISNGVTWECIADEAGNVKVPAKYRYVHLADYTREIYQVSVVGKNGELKVGACDSEGRELIPCEYKDLYCLKVGYALVMDKNNHFWVLDYNNDAIFGPSIYGVDIYGNTDKYLFYTEDNREAGVECLGIYEVSTKTKTAPAVYTYIKYRDDGFFDVKYGGSNGKRAVVDRYGNEQDLMLSPGNFRGRGQKGKYNR